MARKRSNVNGQIIRVVGLPATSSMVADIHGSSTSTTDPHTAGSPYSSPMNENTIDSGCPPSETHMMAPSPNLAPSAGAPLVEDSPWIEVNKGLRSSSLGNDLFSDIPGNAQPSLTNSPATPVNELPHKNVSINNDESAAVSNQANAASALMLNSIHGDCTPSHHTASDPIPKGL